MPKVSKYGLDWEADYCPLQREFYMIKKGGQWKDKFGRMFGSGLLFHYLEARRLLWPHRYRHRWTDLIYSEILKNEITILMGCASSQKSSHIAEWALIDYWAFPKNTFILVSTINVDKLETNIFGEIKMLFQSGRDRFEDLDGNLLDHKHAITTDSIKDEDFDERRARDLRKGIMGRPCFVGAKYVGLGTFAGIKQERFRFIGDELQFMAPTFMDSWSHMFSNPDVKIVGSGNPNHDPDDQMGLAAEPEKGWTSMPEPEKTTVWKTKRLGGVCVNLVGTDSPNFDSPQDKYKGLIGRRYIQRVEHDEGKDSAEYYRLCKGVMKLGFAHSRVITRQLCADHHAYDTALWAGTQRTRIHALDPAYGGGDRCVSMWGEFGKDVNDQVILRLNAPRVIHINLQSPLSPEDQIALSVHDELKLHDIPPNNSFYDAFGKGTIGFAFARKFGANCPVPVESGGKCSDRPVRYDLFIYDEALGRERLKRCDEHYSKRVSEMWFSCRYAIEAEQIRELTEEVVTEGCWREYYTVAGDKIEVEKKDDMREKKGKSPDLFDTFAVLVEGARRRGFQILKLGSGLTSEADCDWFVQDADEFNADLKEHLLIHS